MCLVSRKLNWELDSASNSCEIPRVTVRDVAGKDHLCVGFVIGKRRIIRTERRRERRGRESRGSREGGKRGWKVCVSMCDIQRALWVVCFLFFYFFIFFLGEAGQVTR